MSERTRSRMETEVARCICKMSFLMAGCRLEQRQLAQITSSLTTELVMDYRTAHAGRRQADLLIF